MLQPCEKSLIPRARARANGAIITHALAIQPPASLLAQRAADEVAVREILKTLRQQADLRRLRSNFASHILAAANSLPLSALMYVELKKNY